MAFLYSQFSVEELFFKSATSQITSLTEIKTGKIDCYSQIQAYKSTTAPKKTSIVLEDEWLENGVTGKTAKLVHGSTMSNQIFN